MEALRAGQIDTCSRWFAWCASCIYVPNVTALSPRSRYRPLRPKFMMVVRHQLCVCCVNAAAGWRSSTSSEICRDSALRVLVVIQWKWKFPKHTRRRMVCRTEDCESIPRRLLSSANAKQQPKRQTELM